MMITASLLGLHALFFAPLLVRAAVQRSARARARPGSTAHTAGRRDALLALGVHGAGLALLYVGIAAAALGQPWPPPATATTFTGFVVIAAADAVVAWTAAVFTSWRLRLEVAADHQLCTSGPFALVRHPIYAALDLLALGTALCLPTPLVLAATLLLVAGGWLRARVEERVLLGAFGDAYRSYIARVRGRFLPRLW